MVLAALVVAGIGALVVVYGDVGRLKDGGATTRRELDRLEERYRVLAEAVARMEERTRCAPR